MNLKLEGISKRVTVIRRGGSPRVSSRESSKKNVGRFGDPPRRITDTISKPVLKCPLIRMAMIAVVIVLASDTVEFSPLFAQENPKLEMAHDWGKQKFKSELAAVEAEYQTEIQRAAAKRAQGIKMARVRYLQGLKFLNVNPSLPQAMRETINEEMKRIESLPDPVAPPVADPPTKKPEKTIRQPIDIKLKTPDTGWSIQIQVVKRVNNELWVLSSLRHGADIAGMVITEVHDRIIVEVPPGLPVRHFVLNKTWNWQNDEDAKFISGIHELGRDWALGKNVPVKHN